MNEEQEKKTKHSILSGNWRVCSSLDKEQIKVVIDEATWWQVLVEQGAWMTPPAVAGFQAFETTGEAGHPRHLDRTERAGDNSGRSEETM